MANTILAQPVDSHFLAVMANIKDAIDGLNELFMLADLANEANDVAFGIERALRDGRLPAAKDFEAALALDEKVREALDMIRHGCDHMAVSSRLLLGLDLREPNGDIVEKENACPDAVSEAL